MTEFSSTPHAGSASAVIRGRAVRYLTVGVLANAFIWGAALFFLQSAPRSYSSEWKLLFLGGNGTVGNPPGANGTVSPDAMGSKVSQDLKQAYQVIVSTDSVRKAAASKLGMTVNQFGTPNVSGVAGTELLNLSIAGSSPEEAQKKAYALHEAFLERLNQLRIQQATEQQTSFENSLGVIRKKLETAQLRLSDYKIRSGLVAGDQISQLASNIEVLRRSRAELMAQQRDAVTRFQQLATDLKATPHSVSDALVLQSDALFQQYRKEYSEATANLTNLSAKFGPNHPVIVRETARQAAAEQALQNRAQVLLGRPLDIQAIAPLTLSNGAGTDAGRETLFQNIVTLQAEQQGLAARVQELDQQIFQLERRLTVLAQRNSTLDVLNRDLQIAEAVFSSALSNLDANKSTILNAYPPVQLVAEPTLPTSATIPQKSSILISATLASLFFNLGLLLLWLRKTSFADQFLRKPTFPLERQ